VLPPAFCMAALIALNLLEPARATIPLVTSWLAAERCRLA